MPKSNKNYINNLDEYIIRAQRSTKTTFKIVTPLHDRLRNNFSWYYLWHTFKFTNLIHISALVIYTILVFCFAMISIFPQADRVYAATVTWDGGGTEINCPSNSSSWSCAYNWSTDQIPGSLDTAVFNSTSQKNAFIDVNISVGSINIENTYQGKIFQQNGNLSVENDFVYEGGDFISNPSNLFSVGGSFSLETSATVNSLTDGPVYAMTEDGSGNIYIGGSFTSVGGIMANNIAMWDGSFWHALDYGIDGYVFALEYDADNGKIYAGGQFVTASGATVNNITVWYMGSWQPVAGGFDDTVYTLEETPYGLYAGGDFINAGGGEGTPVNRIARFDGGSWSYLWDGSQIGTSGEVKTIVAGNGQLYVGGLFATAGGVTVNNFASWNFANTWTAFGSGANGSVQSILLNGTDIVVGGYFSQVNGVSAEKVARWNGSAWSALGDGFDDRVTSLVEFSGVIYAGGWFQNSGALSTNRVARWNSAGSTWEALGSGMDSLVFSMLPVDGTLWVGGAFTEVNGNDNSFLAKWDGANWAAAERGRFSRFTGEGTAANPYNIYDVYGLQAMNQNLSAYYELHSSVTSIDASTTSNWNTGEGFRPIGEPGDPPVSSFYGQFEGNNKSIVNLVIDRALYANGLFTGLDGATVQNVNFESLSITGAGCAGAVAGYSTNGSLVKNIKVDNASTFDLTDTGGCLGGIIGDNNAQIIDSKSSSTLANPGPTTGGVAAYNLSNGSIKKSFFDGSVSGHDNVGGLAGYNAGEIIDSYSLSDINGNTGGSNGGLVGNNNGGSISRSYATGSISGGSNNGGFVGYNNGGSYTDNYWDTTTSGTTDGVDGGNVAEVTGKITAEMKIHSTYTDNPPNNPIWDFTTPIWTLDEVANEYPKLAWEGGDDTYDSDPITAVTWDGGGDTTACGSGHENDWSCAENWTGNTLPTADIDVTFDATSTKDSTIDASFAGTIKSLTINSGYTGTITVSKDISVLNNLDYDYPGITTSTGNKISVAGNYTIGANAAGGDGLIELNGVENQTIYLPTTAGSAPRGLTIDKSGGSVFFDTSSGGNELNLDGDVGDFILTAGTIDLQNQDIAIRASNFTMTSGNINSTGGAGTLIADEWGTWSNSGITGINGTWGTDTTFEIQGGCTWNPGSVSWKNVEVNANGGSIIVSENNANITGNLTLTAGTVDQSVAETINVDGNYIIGAGADAGYGSVVIDGSSDQTVYLASPYGASPNLQFVKSSGKVLFDTSSGGSTLDVGGAGVGDITVNLTGTSTMDLQNQDITFYCGGLIWTSGDINSTGGSGTLIVTGSPYGTGIVGGTGTWGAGTTLEIQSGYTWNPGSVVYKNLEINSASETPLTVSGNNANITGNLTLTAGNIGQSVAETINVDGNYIIGADAGYGVVITLDGSGSQSVVLSAGCSSPDLKIDKSSGTVTFDNTSSSLLDFSGGVGTFTLQSGTVDLAGKDIELGLGFFNLNGGSIISTGTPGSIKFGGMDSHLGTIAGGVSGSIDTNVTLEVNNDGKSWDPGSVQWGNIQLDTANTLTMTGGPADINGDLVIQAGASLVTGNYDIEIAGNWQNAAGATGFDAGTGEVIFDGSSQSITGSTTFNDLTMATDDQVISFDALSTTTVSGTWNVGGSGIGNEVILQQDGTSGGNQWSVDTTGATVNVSYASVQDSAATIEIDASDGTNIDGGNNNTNWVFTSSGPSTELTSWVWDGGGDGSTWTDELNWDLDSYYPSNAYDSVTINTAVDLSTPSEFALTLGSIELGINYANTFTLQNSLIVDDSLGASGAINILNANGILYLNGKGLTVTEYAPFSNEGTLQLDGNETIVGFVNNDPNSGTIEYIGSGDYSASNLAAGTYYFNLTVSGSGSFQQSGPNFFDNIFVVNNFNQSNGSINFENMWIANGNFYLSGGTYNIPAGGYLGANNDLVITDGILEANDYVNVNGTFSMPEGSTGTFNGHNILHDASIFNQAGGTYNSTSDELDIYDSFIRTGGVFNHNDGKVVMWPSTNCQIDALNTTFYDLEINALDEGGYARITKDITVDNNLNIVGSSWGNDLTVVGDGAAETSISIGGNLSSTIDDGPLGIGWPLPVVYKNLNFDLAGDLSLASGTQIAANINFVNTGTVSHILGSNTLEGSFSAVAGKEIQFEAGTTQTISGETTLTGTSGNLIKLRSTVDANQWSIDPQDISDISYVDVKDSVNLNGTVINPANSLGEDQNNVDWFNTAPSAPTSTVITPKADPTQISVGWTQTSDNEDGFKIYVAAKASGACSEVADWGTATTAATPNLETYDIDSLSINTRYCAKVTAYNSEGESGGAISALATFTLANTPSAPTLTANSWDETLGNSISVTINASSNPAVTEYAISCDASGNNWLQGDGTCDTTEVWKTEANWETATVNYLTNLTADTNYTIFVRAKNGDSVETTSEPTAQAATAPAKVANPTHASNTTNAITWSWDANSSAPDGYKVYDYSGGICTLTEEASVLHPNIQAEEGTLSENTQYSRCVRAFRGSLLGEPSIQTQAYTSIQTPTGITFNDLDTTYIQISATGTLSNLAEGQSGLYFTETTGNTNGGGAGFLTWTQTNDLTDAGLSINTQYGYKVKARNGDGDATAETAVSLKYTLADIPGTPLLSDATDSSINIEIDLDANPASTTYAIYNETESEYVQADGSLDPVAFYQTRDQWGGDSGIINTGLTGSTLYTYSVIAKNEDGVITLNSDSASLSTSITTYVINVSTGVNGRVEKDSAIVDGEVIVDEGDDAVFTIIPDLGYHVDDVVVDSVSQGAISEYAFTNVTESHTIVATFAIDTFTVTINTIGNGSTDEITQDVDYGSNLTITATPEIGSNFDGWTGDITDPDATVTISNITDNTTITANFSLKTFTVTATVEGGNGSVDFAEQIVNYGESASISFLPDPNYHLATIEDNGVVKELANPYVILDVREAHNVVVTFELGEITSYTISAIANENGSITPSGNVIVEENSDKIFAITPDAGYHIDDVLVDGVSVGDVDSYIFENITDNHSIEASFAIDYYNINISKTGNGYGATSHTSMSVAYGTDLTITATPAASSNFTGWTGDTVSGNNTITLTDIDSDKTLVASFALKEFTVNIYTTGNCTLSVPTTFTMLYGESRLIGFTPDTGYYFAELVVNNNAILPNNYQISFIDRNYEIRASFELMKFTVTINKTGSGFGTLSAQTQQVNYGSSLTVTATPEINSNFVGWSGDFSGSGSAVLANITSNKSLTAEFNVKTFTITAAISTIGSKTGGIITPENETILAYGQSQAYLITPSAGFQIKDVLIDGKSIGAVSAYDFNKVSANHQIIAKFEPIPAKTEILIEVIGDENAIIIPNKNIDMSYLGKTVEFIIGAKEGYLVEDVIVDGQSVGAVKSYIFKEIEKQHKIEVKTKKVTALVKIINDISDAVAETIQNAINNAPKAITAAINQTIKQIFNVLGAVGVSKEQAPQALSATALGTAIATAPLAPIANATSMLSLSEFVRSVWQSIFALFGGIRRKRKNSGKVLENGSGLPIAQAKVELVRIDKSANGAEIEKLISGTFTDKEGNYGFVVEIGKYRVRVYKDLYTSKEIKNISDIIEVTSDKDGLIVPTFYLSMNQLEVKKKYSLIQWFNRAEKFLGYISFIFLAAGTFVAIEGIITNRSSMMITMLAIYFILWVINVKSLVKRSPWGTVIDKKTDQAIPLTLIRIFDRSGNKLIKTAISNEKGKFSTFLSKGEFSIIAAKNGYKQPCPIAINTKTNFQAIDRRIELDKISNLS